MSIALGKQIGIKLFLILVNIIMSDFTKPVDVLTY